MWPFLCPLCGRHLFLLLLLSGVFLEFSLIFQSHSPSAFFHSALLVTTQIGIFLKIFFSSVDFHLFLI